jgi:Sec-independent protein translocase protein TatA
MMMMMMMMMIIIIIIIIIMSNEKLKEKFGSCTRKTFDGFTTKVSYTWKVTHNTDSTAV